MGSGRRLLESPHVPIPRLGPSCGVVWECGEVGSAGYVHVCSVYIGRSAKDPVVYPTVLKAKGRHDPDGVFWYRSSTGAGGQVLQNKSKLWSVL